MKQYPLNIRSELIKRKGIAFSLLLIALTNIVVIEIDGFQPVTVFILYFPIIIYFIFTRLPFLGKPEAVILTGYLFLVCLVNLGEVRWSSFAYSILFCIFFLFINQNQYFISNEYFEKISKTIIYLYLINVVFAQALFFSSGQLEPLDWLLKGSLNTKTGEMRFQGFSSEPSYAAFVVLVAFLVYNRLTNETRKSKIMILLSVIYLTVSFNSIYGYIIAVAIGLDFILRRHIFNKFYQLIFLFITIIGLIVISGLGISGESRTGELILFILSGNLNLASLMLIDPSAFMRIGPFFEYLEEMDFSIQTFIGYGPGASGVHFGSVFSDMIDSSAKGYESGTIGSGFFPAFLYDYGIIGAVLMYLLVFRHGMSRIISVESFIIFLMLFNANFNTQLFWYVWAMLFIMNQVYNRNFRYGITNKSGKK